jgi:excisionase family DNA binding protein
VSIETQPTAAEGALPQSARAFFTIDQAAEALQVDRRKIEQLLADGVLPFFKHGRVCRINARALMDLGLKGRS